MNMMKTIVALAIVASCAAAAEPAENPYYLRASYLSLQEDWRSFNGGESRGHGFEIGYTHGASAENVITWGLYAGFVKSVGKMRPELDTYLSANALRMGVDVVFNTPIEPLRAYAGLNLQYWDGQQETNSKVLGPKTAIPDTNAKFGLRLGVEYRITQHWGVSLDYNASEWISDQDKSTYPMTGYNPVNPSWVALSVQYRFNAFRRK